MIVRFSTFVMRALEVLFFIGLAGCVLVVLFSWISILGSELRGGE